MTEEAGEHRVFDAARVLERVRASFEKQGLMRLPGAEIVEAGVSGVRIRAGSASGARPRLDTTRDSSFGGRSPGESQRSS